MRLSQDAAISADPLHPCARKLVELAKGGIARHHLSQRARTGEVVAENLRLLARLERERTPLLLDRVPVLDNCRRDE